MRNTGGSAPDIMVAVDSTEAAADLQAVLDAAPSNPIRAKQAFELGGHLFIEGLRTLLPTEHSRAGTPERSDAR